MVNQTEIDGLKQQFEKDGKVSTPIYMGDLAHTTIRLEKLVEMKGVDAIVVSGDNVSVMLDKESTESIIPKIYYFASLSFAHRITFAKKEMRETAVPEKVCSFNEFSKHMERRGMGYRARQRG